MRSARRTDRQMTQIANLPPQCDEPGRVVVTSTTTSSSPPGSASVRVPGIPDHPRPHIERQARDAQGLLTHEGFGCASESVSCSPARDWYVALGINQKSRIVLKKILHG